VPSLSGKIVRELGRWIPAGLLMPLARPAALFFHGVEESIDDPSIQHNHHNAETFRAIAESLKSHFTILPLSAMTDVIEHPDRHGRSIFLMSDDGYANATVAADILEDLQIPWTLFVSTHHIDTGERNPMFLANLFFWRAPAGDYRLPHFDTTLKLSTLRNEVAAEGIAKFRRLDAAKAREALDFMMATLKKAGMGNLPGRYKSDAFLTWDQIRALANRGVAIGAHAHWHMPMHSRQTRAYLAEQARLPRERIIAEVGECRAFAYPFGNVGDVSQAAWKAVKLAGYDYGFTTLAGTLDGGHNRWLLPRYGIGLSETNVASMVPLLRTGNARLARWQRELAA
jgi:peptidoglycan/xylan/chitin deacetylase (PgdA/CDA1 family)